MADPTTDRIPLAELPAWVGKKVYFTPLGSNATLESWDGCTVAVCTRKGDSRKYASFPTNVHYPVKG